jgi:hypothetical protein
MNTHGNESRDAKFRGTLVALLAGFAVFALLVLADQISIHYGLEESQRALDDFCGGLVAAFLVYRYERFRQRQLTQQLRTIAAMNHHVRNALQVVMYSASVPSDKEQLNRIRSAVQRIEWALQEVLPGYALDLDNDWPKAMKESCQRSESA